jgi:hypothetical protein
MCASQFGTGMLRAFWERRMTTGAWSSAGRRRVNFLYHGSSVPGLKILKPFQRYKPGAGAAFAAVYATPFPTVAAIHGFEWKSEDRIDFTVASGIAILIIPVAQEHRLAQPVSVYRVMPDGFQKTSEDASGTTWHSTDPVGVCDEAYFTSVSAAIREFGGVVRYVA